MKDKLNKYWLRLVELIGPILLRFRPDVLAPYSNRERVTVYVVATVLALFLWGYVNLNRDFILELETEIRIDEIAEDRALTQKIPNKAYIKVRGEGWQLLSLYNNPPRLNLSILEDQPIDLQLRFSNEIKKYGLLNLEQVTPEVIHPKLSKKITKSVPVVADFQLTFKDQFYPISELEVAPDSIVISGAEELINAIPFIKTIPTSIKNVQQNLNFRLGLQTPELIDLSTTVVEVQQDVEQFTEAEVDIEVLVSNVPEGLNVVLNPRTVIVRFDVPLTAFQKVKGLKPFSARVNYSDLLKEQSGYFIPVVSKQQIPFEIIYKDHQPQRLRYFINRNN